MSKFWDDKWTDSYGAFHKKYYIAKDLLNKEDLNKKILDMGSGNGNLFDLLSQYHFLKKNLYVSDLSSKALEICQNKSYNVAVKNESFDIITVVDVLEHVEDPYTFLGELKLKTEDLIIVVPNFNSYKQRLEVLIGRIPFQNKMQRGGHILWVNYKFLLSLFNQLEFEIIDTYHLYSKTGNKNSINYKIQNIFPNLFANSYGFRIRVKKLKRK
jgi:2-polyprenyl-3-methyl-5-hydroxy-6-metoxy-1,4-benzoquinol methylase